MKRIAFGLMLCGASLFGQEDDDSVRFGFLVQGTQPFSDLKTRTEKQRALGGSAFLEFGVDVGVRVRPGISFDYYPSKDGPLGDPRKHASRIGLDLDALWHPNGDDDFYFVGGLDLERWNFVTVGGNSKSYWGPGLRFGVGYQFSEHMGAELRGGFAHLSSGLDAETVSLAVTFRF
jgi:Outer membrane protein beta-barrel domain